MALVSPCGLAPSTMPSSVHCIGSIALLLGAPDVPQRERPSDPSARPRRLDHKAPIVRHRRHPPVGCACMKHEEIVLRLVQHIGMNRIAARAVEKISEAVD